MGKGVFIRRLLPRAALALFVTLALMACSSGTTEKEKVVAKVNGAAVTAAELQREIEGYGKNNPITRHTIDDRLQLIIEQKLLIQEAVRMGIPEDKKFVETIKTFWEQTIIRNLIEAKSAELSGKIFVTEQEIANEYDKMKYRPRIRAVRGVRTKEDAAAVVRQMQGGKRIDGEEIIGPMFYEDVKGSPLADAFDMKEGQTEAFDAAGEHIVIGVIDRESIPLPPLKELEKRIRESILVQKRQKALADWIAVVKKNAEVEIDESELRRIGHE
jgi:parvulin-like peptidyl-prolyl isomerase